MDLRIQGTSLLLGHVIDPVDVVHQQGVYSWDVLLSTAPAPADDTHLVPLLPGTLGADKRSPTVTLWAENSSGVSFLPNYPSEAEHRS